MATPKPQAAWKPVSEGREQLHHAVLYQLFLRSKRTPSQPTSSLFHQPAPQGWSPFWGPPHWLFSETCLSQFSTRLEKLSVLEGQKERRSQCGGGTAHTAGHRHNREWDVHRGLWEHQEGALILIDLEKGT